MIRVRIDSKKAEALLARLAIGFRPENLDAVVGGVAAHVLADAVTSSPKKWFGQIRSAWKVEKTRDGVRSVEISRNAVSQSGTSISDIARFVDQGTANNGAGFIYPTRSKFLYVPLTRRAAAGWNSNLIQGTDYVLRKRVRGQKAQNFVAGIARRARQRMQTEARRYVRGLIKG